MGAQCVHFQTSVVYLCVVPKENNFSVASQTLSHELFHLAGQVDVQSYRQLYSAVKEDVSKYNRT